MSKSLSLAYFTRRSVPGLFVAAALLSVAPAIAGAQTATDASRPKELTPASRGIAQPFTLPELPYATDALQPYIDAETMDIHRTRHHKAQVDALNAAIAKDPALASLTLEQILASVSRWPAAVRNNAGGHWNHTFFWSNLAPHAQQGRPSEALLARVQRDFGSLEAMQKAFDAAAVSRFGSGWAWLVVRDDGPLAVTSTPNQDNPLMDVAEMRGTPILGLDVWEHAYYLRYRNRRAEYATAWWNVVNWNDVNRRHAEAIRAGATAD